MTPQLLTAVGQALYGGKWQKDLGKHLGVNRRTIARWVSGEYRVPEGAAAEIYALCIEREAALRDFRRGFSQG